MSNSTLTKIIVELYQKLNSEEPNIAIKESIHEMVESNGLGSYNNIPSWFLDFWQNILNKKPTEKVQFLMSEIVNSDADIINFMAELADIINMNYENYGEGIVMKFETLNLDAFICLEGGPSTCFYQIKLLDKNIENKSASDQTA
ncbi:hypothetical protein [Microseira sp. BLCC-F43]|jgi:hypothetical protein|uniref:hypothetical protein n=1 Tax=Microseira sp. BLCC-F43 TaxID=3153602 RepID=UPI0035B7AC8D